MEGYKHLVFYIITLFKFLDSQDTKVTDEDFYEEIFGNKDLPLKGIFSHMSSISKINYYSYMRVCFF